MNYHSVAYGLNSDRSAGPRGGRSFESNIFVSKDTIKHNGSHLYGALELCVFIMCFTDFAPRSKFVLSAILCLLRAFLAVIGIAQTTEKMSSGSNRTLTGSSFRFSLVPRLFISGVGTVPVGIPTLFLALVCCWCSYHQHHFVYGYQRYALPFPVRAIQIFGAELKYLLCKPCCSFLVQLLAIGWRHVRFHSAATSLFDAFPCAKVGYCSRTML